MADDKSNNIFNSIQQGISDATALVNDISRLIDNAVGLNGSQENAADPNNVASQRQNSFTHTSALSWGVVTDCIPYMDQYRVQPEGLGMSIVCSRLRNVGGAMLGATDTSSITPGTVVYIIRHPRMLQGFIIGAVPYSGENAARGFSDQFTQASNSGLKVATDTAYRFPDKMTKNENKGVVDRSARNPIDQTNAGEWSIFTETGLCASVDSYMAQMRVDEFTGLFMYYWDQLCRLAGANLQIWGAGYELESYDDQGETFFYNGIATYPWEAMAQLSRPVDVTKERDAETIQTKETWYTRFEPENDDAQAFHRSKTYSGYIGQGFRRMLATPFGHSKPNTVNQYETETNFAGLFEEQVTLAGHYALRSALGLTIGKRPVIPVPKRIKTVQDPTGDTEKNYKASGQYGSGTEHKCTSDVTASFSRAANLQRALGVFDLHTHIFNWEGPHPFYYHKEDYHYPNDSDMEEITNNWESIDFSKLKTAQNISPPEPVTVNIDHRDGGTAKVFQNSSSLTFLDDGGITLTDGFGSQIRMTGGNIHITAPGDVFVESGRNFTAWAGRDVIMRAYQSVDVTATSNDVRLKAEKNMQLLAANGGGAHGMLLESRSDEYDWRFHKCGHAAEYSGIVLRAKDSAIVNWSKGYYTKALGEDWKAGIIFDANDGGGNVGIRAKHFDRWCLEHSRDFFVDGNELEGGTTVRSVVWNGKNNTLDGILYCDKDIYCNAEISAKSNIKTVGNLYASQTEVQEIGGQAGRLNARMRQYSNMLREHRSDANRKTKVIDKEWYYPRKPGNKDIIKKGEFGLRIDADYCVKDFLLFETNWAQHARLVTKSVPEKWTEKVVDNAVAPNEETYPFPGRARLVSDKVYYQQDWNFVSVTDGIGKDRAGDHESNPKYATPTEKTLDGNYAIIGICED